MPATARFRRVRLRWSAVAWILTAVLPLAACGDGGLRLDDRCAERCASRQCGMAADCPCGTCAADRVCSLAGDCVPFVDCPGDCDEMVHVPAGVFIMGSASGAGLEDEQPAHLVILSEYEIDKYELTVARYRRCVEAGVCSRDAMNPDLYTLFGGIIWRGYFEDPVYDEYPMQYLSRSDAEDVCVFEGRRLPTEAEWEKAARGGCEVNPPDRCGGEDEHIHPWGNETPTCEHDNIDGCMPTHGIGYPLGSVPVATYRHVPSPYGAVSLGANVDEFVQDYYRHDAYWLCRDGCTDPVITIEDLRPTDVGGAVVRGDEFSGGLDIPGFPPARITRRRATDHVSDSRSLFTGVRCARSVTPPPLPAPTADSGFGGVRGVTWTAGATHESGRANCRPMFLAVSPEPDIRRTRSLQPDERDAVGASARRAERVAQRSGVPHAGRRIE